MNCITRKNRVNSSNLRQERMLSLKTRAFNAFFTIKSKVMSHSRITLPFKVLHDTQFFKRGWKEMAGCNVETTS
ncbi:unnamed protein product, partial [Heterobilharzia americana]